jgi:hypothetical protein
MRRLLGVVILALLAAVVAPTAALATHSNGQGPGDDFLNGAAKQVLLGVPPACIPNAGHFHTNGKAEFNSPTGAGPNAKGQFWTTIDFSPTGGCLGFQTAEFNGEVICVNAGDSQPPNSVVWRGIIESVTLQPGDVPGIPGILFAGDTVLSRHVDNDGPFGTPGAPDQAIGFRQPPGQTTCPPIPFSTSPITQGNLVVHDEL